MVFKSLDGYFCGITAMDIRGNKLLVDLFLKEGLLEEITGFITHYMDLGLVSRTCKYVKEFLKPFVDACT